MIKLGRWTEAKIQHERVLHLNPNEAGAQEGLAELNMLMNEYQMAEQALEQDPINAVQAIEKILKASPYHTPSLVLKGIALVHMKKYDDALNLATQLLQMDASSTDALYIRGKVWYYQDNFEEAVACFNRALSLNPGTRDFI